jgi:hypothetical protein
MEYKNIVEIQSSDEQSLDDLFLDRCSILGPNGDLLVREKGNLYLQRGGSDDGVADKAFPDSA